MHSKRKGNIGQFAVATKLAEYGFSVFTEEGDISKVDLIAEKGGKLLRIQVKAVTPKNNVVICKFTKSGPNYSFTYTPDMFDYFAVYDLINKGIYFVSNKFLTVNIETIAMRLVPAKNNQWKKIRMASEFAADKILSEITMDLSGVEPASSD